MEKSKEVDELSMAEKRRQFWKHCINPITGFRESINTRLTGSGFIAECSITQPNANGFKKQ